MLTVFGDESHDERRERVFAVAGLLGADADWNAVVPAWTERTGGKVFHAATCETEYANHPDRALHKENLRLYADLTRILAGSNLMGFGAAMHIGGWRNAFPASQQAYAPERAYHKCFSEVVIYFGRIAGLSIPPERVKFTFDRNLEQEFTAHELYTLIAQSPDWPYGCHLADELSSATIASPKIQMADLVAREAMKHLDNEIGPAKRATRLSMSKLLESKRFRFEEYMPEYSTDLIESAAKVAAASGLTAEKYKEWLRTNHLTDTLAHRIKFVAASEVKPKSS